MNTRNLNRTLGVIVLAGGLSMAVAADKQSATPLTHLPQTLKETPPVKKDAAPPPMTHFDPGKLTPAQADLPTVDPGKVPSDIGPSTPPDTQPPAPSGPNTLGIQTTDHLLDDMQHRMPGNEGRYEGAIRDMFGDIDHIRDLPGMEGSKVDPTDMLGGKGNDKLGKYHDAHSAQDGLEGTDFMPPPTTPKQTPANARGGSRRAPVGPKNPRDAMAGAASGDGPNWETKSSMHFLEDGTVIHHEVTGDPDSGEEHSHARVENPDGTEGEYDAQVHPDGSGYYRMRTRDTQGNIIHSDEGSIPSRFEQDLDDEGTTRDPYESVGNSAWVLWHYRNLYHGPKGEGIKDPNRGPPRGSEDGASEAPPANAFDLGDDLVINPDPVNAAGAAGGRPPSAIDSRSHIEKNKTPGAFTPK